MAAYQHSSKTLMSGENDCIAPNREEAVIHNNDDLNGALGEF